MSTSPRFDAGGKAQHEKMAGLVETMLRLHMDLPKARTRPGGVVIPVG